MDLLVCVATVWHPKPIMQQAVSLSPPAGWFCSCSGDRLAGTSTVGWSDF